MCSLIRMSSSDLVLRIRCGRWMGWREGDLVAHGRVIERQISTTNGRSCFFPFPFSFTFTSLYSCVHPIVHHHHTLHFIFRSSQQTLMTVTMAHRHIDTRCFTHPLGRHTCYPLSSEREMAGSLASSPTHSSFLFAGGGVLPLYLQTKKISRGREGMESLRWNSFFFY